LLKLKNGFNFKTDFISKITLKIHKAI
jgi:hypothetical protein